METKIQPFDSFRLLYKILIRLGFYKLSERPKYKILGFLHQLYRAVVFIWGIVYNIQHIIYLVQIYDDKDKFFDAMMYAVPQVCLITKTLSLITGVRRLEEMKKVMHDPIFAAHTKKDEEHLLNNRIFMMRIIKLLYSSVIFSSFLWTFTPVLKRMYDDKYILRIYVPFEVNNWWRFSLSLFIMSGVFPWVAFGHVTMDILILCYYFQAYTQIKIIRSHLETLCEDIETNDGRSNTRFQYLDHLNPMMKERLIHCVERYEKVVWFVRNIEAVFNTVIASQLFSTSLATCFVIFGFSALKFNTNQSTNVIAILFLTLFYFILQSQVFMFCVSAEFVQYESQFVVDSAYMTNWYELSPGFRKLLVFTTTRWIKPIKPFVLGIFPVSLTTFLTIVRAAFSLYTLITKK